MAEAGQLHRAEKSGYIPSLDGWRTVAILLVIVAHNRSWRLGGFESAWLHGGRGVRLFFALSGLLICTRLLREERRFGGISLRSFYTRRLFRIQPAALVYLAVISLLMLAGVIPRVWSAVLGSALMVRTFLPRTATNWETAHFWSLAVEEQFYLFLPGFLVLFRRRRLAVLSALVVAFDLWGVLVMRTPRLQGFAPLIYLRTDMVVGTILLGSVCALALQRERVIDLAKAYLYPWVSFLYTALVFSWLGAHNVRFDRALEMTVYPLLLVSTMLHPASWTSRFLELPPLRFIGRISYSLYLWQMLFFNPFVVPAPGSFHSHVFLCWCATFACAIASYYLIEKPLIHYGHRMAKRFDRQELEKHIHLASTLVAEGR